MFVDFENLSENSKVWIYPCNRKFYSTEIEKLENTIKKFVEKWDEENHNFKSSYQLIYNQFIIFYIDEQSIVKNNHLNELSSFILNLEKEYQVILLDRMNVCFKQGEYIQYKDIIEFKKLLKNKSVSKKTIVFDNLIQTKYELDNFWEIPITESWYSRFL